MKSLMAMVMASAGVFGACASRPSPTINAIDMYPVVVGSKTPLYEVVAPNALKLAPGVTFEVTEGPCGESSGFVLMRPNGGIGGYVACGCIDAMSGNCITTSDNPEHPSCSGNCFSSEGRAHGCEIFGPIIGPPRDPLRIRFLARPPSGQEPGAEKE